MFALFKPRKGSDPKSGKPDFRLPDPFAANGMQQLLEFYEMISLNDAALRDSERAAILQARLALGMFEGAMESFKMGPSNPAPAAQLGLRLAA